MKDIDLAGIYLQDIKNFLSAAESLNFSQVARENEITHSAVSKSIKRLELATNLILFARYSGKMKLTPAGREFQKQLNGYISVFENATADAHRIQEGISDGISIGFPNEHDLPWIAGCVQALKKQYRDLSISVGIYDFPVLKKKLQEGSLDVIFTVYFECETLQNTDISWKLINQMPLCVFVPESNPLSMKDHVTIEDLRSEHFVIHSPSMVPGYQKLLNDLCKPYGFTPLVKKYSDNIGSFIMDLIFGDSVLIGDELLYANIPDSVKCFPLQGTVSGRVIAWNSARDNKVIQDFIRICLQKNR